MLAFMASVPGQQMTVQEIFEGMKDRGSRIGMTTVYRQLERLVEAGEVNRYVLDSNGGALFEYIDRQTNCHKPACFHCKCESCGRLIHLECRPYTHSLLGYHHNAWSRRPRRHDQDFI